MALPGSTLIDVVRCDRSCSYLAIYLIGFVAVMGLAVVGSLLGLKWRSWFPGAEGGGSLVASVSAVVCSFMSFTS